MFSYNLSVRGGLFTAEMVIYGIQRASDKTTRVMPSVKHDHRPAIGPGVRYKVYAHVLHACIIIYYADQSILPYTIS